MFSILIRTTIMYILIMFSVRLMGKKNLGEFQPVDLVATMLISNLTSLVLEAPNLPVIYSVVPILLISCFEVFSSQFARKSEKFAAITQGKSMVLIQNGILNQQTMSDLRFTVSDVLEAMRNKDIFYLEDVSVAIVETTGAVDIYELPQNYQKTNKSSIPPFEIVMDGIIQKENYKYIDFSDDKLEEIIINEKINISQILLMLVDGDGNYNYTIKENI